MSESISAKKKCNGCVELEPKGYKHEHLEQIGRPVEQTVFIGRGYDKTNYKFFQCMICGSLWVEIIDSGAGGHDHHWQKLTKGLF